MDDEFTITVDSIKKFVCDILLVPDQLDEIDARYRGADDL